MTRSLPLLGGYPYQLRILADSLMGSASRLSAVNTVLLSLRAGAHWDSDSGRLFEADVQTPPPIIAAVIERYAGAAQAIRTLADELDEAQRVVTGAISSHREAWRRHDALMERRGFATDPLEQNDLERAMNGEVAVVDAAERRHAAAVHGHTEADRRCARQLRALAEDVLDDPTGYTWMANAEKVSGPVAMVGSFLPGPFRAIGGIGAGAGTLSRVGLLVFYDEGSWKEIGINLISSTVGVTGKLLVNTATWGAKGAIVAGERVFSKTANPSIGFRVGAGARVTLDDVVVATRRKFGLPVPTKMPRVPDRPRLPGPDPSILQKGQNFAQKQIDDAFINNMELAMANGKGAQVMFVAGITTQKAPGVVKQVNGVHDRVVTARAEKSEDKAATPTYP